MASISSSVVGEALSDEVEAINAIYGEQTMNIITAESSKVTARIVLPFMTFVDDVLTYDFVRRKWVTSRKFTNSIPDVCFLVDFAHDYPATRPRGRGLEATMLEYRQRSLWKVHLILVSTLQVVFDPGSVCIFDFIEFVMPLLCCLIPTGLDLTMAKRLLSNVHFDHNTWQWAFRSSVDMSKAFEQCMCAICLDERYALQMIGLPCGHPFCAECFRAGWNASTESNAPYTCCLQRIPLKLIQELIPMTGQHAVRYSRLLIERDTPHPIFCASPSCSHLIGGLDVLKRFGIAAKCPNCHESTCMVCRARAHRGGCSTPELEYYMQKHKVRRCMYCGVGIQKDGGCSHMMCKMCGTHFTWQSDGGMVQH